MTKLFLTSGIALLLGLGAASAQTGKSPPGSPTGATRMSQAQCTSLWNTADRAKSGSLTQSQAAPYITNFRSADTNSDGKLVNAEFMAACNRGLVKSSGAGTGAGAGTSGAVGGSPGSRK